MNKLILSLVSAVLITACAAQASAEVIDTSTIACEKLVAAYKAKTEGSVGFVNGILNWMGGYHATEKQGTVVDWKKLSKAIDQTIEYCAEHPNVGVMSASEKFMGEQIEEAGPEALDVAIVTCENTLSANSIATGNTFMWLSGYHTSTNKESTMLDIEKFKQHITQIAEYCVANPKTGLVTASEKFMADKE